jgi:hypothetical protein
MMLYHSENDEVEQLPFWQLIKWSPDGQWLTFIGHSAQEGYKPGVWLKAVDATNDSTHHLSESDSYYVAWSADSSQVAVGSSGEVTTISVPEMTEHVLAPSLSYHWGDILVPQQ